jgi:hypothetical protein
MAHQIFEAFLSFDSSNVPFKRGETTSQASLVISHSSVRGLSDASREVLNEEDLLVAMLMGTKALALKAIAASNKDVIRNCIGWYSYSIYSTR